MTSEKFILINEFILFFFSLKKQRGIGLLLFCTLSKNWSRKMTRVRRKTLRTLGLACVVYWEQQSLSILLTFWLAYSFVLCRLFYYLLYAYLIFNSIADFFKELPQFVVKAGPTLSNLYGTDWENRLEVLTEQRTTIAFAKFIFFVRWFCLFIWLIPRNV